MVEHAPYIPKNGMFSSRSPNDVPMHWFKRSPARMKSTSAGVLPALSSARMTASRCRVLSAFSNEISPSVSSV